MNSRHDLQGGSIFVLPTIESMVFDWITLALGGSAVACAVGVWYLTRPSEEPKRAVDYYSGLVRRNPGDTNARFELGLALLRRGMLVESIHEFREVVEQNPKHAQAHHSLGVALLNTGNLNAAVLHLEIATKLSPIFAEAFANLGSLLQMQGDTHGAKGALLRAVSIEPKLAIAHFNLGRCYLQEGDPVKAIGALANAVKHDQSMRDEIKCGTDFDALLGNPQFRQLVYG